VLKNDIKYLGCNQYNLDYSTTIFSNVIFSNVTEAPEGADEDIENVAKFISQSEKLY